MFKIWDLHREDKRPGEIIKAIWPDEYKRTDWEREVDKSDIFKQRLEFYKSQGYADAYEKACKDAYGYTEDEDEEPEKFNDTSGSGRIKLYMRVNDTINRMQELFGMFEN